MGAEIALVVNSGMAALDVITRLLKSGDEVIAGDDLYGGNSINESLNDGRHKSTLKLLENESLHCSSSYRHHRCGNRQMLSHRENGNGLARNTHKPSYQNRRSSYNRQTIP